MPNTFQEFLSRNSLKPGDKLPLFHTTAAYSIKSIRKDGGIRPQICDVYENNPLSYFFVGRPSYRVRGGEGEAEVWELPCCFVFEYEAVANPVGVLPFDSGAFAAGRMPHYISMMKKEAFESVSIPDAPRRIVGAYFSSTESYFRGKAKDTQEFQREFLPGVFDEEVVALHRLAHEKHNTKVDDRRLTVEMRSDKFLDLTVSKPIAVIAPMPYLDDVGFRDHVTEVWGAKPIAYPISSLSVEEYSGQIYERVQNLYIELGLL